MRLAAVCACLALVVGVPAAAPAAGSRSPPHRDFVWAGHHFETARQFRAWLGRQGISYARWAKSHPGGVEALGRVRPSRAVAAPGGPPAGQAEAKALRDT